tara:strand:+ start:812 stop:1507 length:696 start_codon:yes stop_codon:yes gene_type:complete
MSNAVKKSSDDQFYVSNLEAIYSAIDKVSAIIEFNLDGTILTANNNFCQALGYTEDEIKGKHHRIFCDPAFTNSLDYARFWEKLSRGEFEQQEYKRYTKSGKEIWIQASYNPIFDESGKPYKVVKFATDITKQKLESLVFEATLEAVSKSQAVIEFNMDGSIVTANDNFLSTLGYSLSEIQGKHHRIFCEKKFAESQEYKDFWAKLNRGDFEAKEYKRVSKSGAEIWIQAS